MRSPAPPTARANPHAPPRRSRLTALACCLPLVLLAFGTAEAAPAASTSSTASTTAQAGATLWTPGIRDAAHPGRFEREFARRKALLKSPGPEAVLALLGAMAELQGEIPGAEMAAFLDGARKHREPLVAAHAGYLRANLEEARGDQAKATAMYRAEGDRKSHV